MAIQVRWDDDTHSIIYCEFGVTWTLEEYQRHVDDILGLVTSVKHPVYQIHDFANSRVPPRQWLTAGRYVETHSTPQTVFSVVVGANSYVKILLNVAQRLFLRNIPVYMADTKQEAYALINAHQNKTIASP